MESHEKDSESLKTQMTTMLLESLSQLKMKYLLLLSSLLNLYLLWLKMMQDEETASLCNLEQKYKTAEAENPAKAEVAASEHLKELFDKFDSDKGWNHGYHRYYGPILAPYKSRDVRLVEIGVEKGNSMRAWLHFFTRPQHIYGIGYGSLNEWQEGGETACFKQQSLPCSLFKGDQGDGKFLKHFLQRTGGSFDIVIDDGSHLPSHQRFTFEHLWPAVKAGGYYIIEDVETSYWNETAGIYGYSFKGEKSVVEHFKLVADVVNKKYANHNSPLPQLYSDVSSIRFGANIMILQKQAVDETKWFTGPYKHKEDSAGKPLPYP